MTGPSIADSLQGIPKKDWDLLQAIKKQIADKIPDGNDILIFGFSPYYGTGFWTVRLDFERRDGSREAVILEGWSNKLTDVQRIAARPVRPGWQFEPIQKQEQQRNPILLGKPTLISPKQRLAELEEKKDKLEAERDTKKKALQQALAERAHAVTLDPFEMREV